MKKFLTFVSVSALSLGSLVPAVMADVEIVDNGADSTQTVVVSATSTQTVNQTNNTAVETIVDTTNNTGGNTVTNNTGGDSTLETGTATASTFVVVTGSTNDATGLDACGCLTSPDVIIAGNGAGSNQTVVASTSQTRRARQTNNSMVGTLVLTRQRTGKNKVSNNTNGSSTLFTGSAVSTVGVSVTAPSNTLN